MANEIAKALWDTSLGWLDAADKADDINSTIAYTGMAEIALAQARFAAEYPYLVGGASEAGIPYIEAPEGSTPNEQGIPVPTNNTPMPPGPEGGPKLWGAPRP